MTPIPEAEYDWLAALYQQTGASHGLLELDPDDPRWQRVEGQLLQLSSPQWQPQQAQPLYPLLHELLTEYKDLRLLQALLSLMLQNPDLSRWRLAVRLLDCWLHDLPAAPPVCQTTRQRLLHSTLLRIVKSGKCLPLDSAAIDTWHSLLSHLTEQDESARWAQALSVTVTTPSSSAPESDSPPVCPTITVLAAPSTPQPDRQAQLLVARHLTLQMPEQCIGYRLRRHAIWAHIQLLPEHDDNGKTALMAPEEEYVASYLSPADTIDQLMALEHHLEQAPFWFHGHCLAANLAQQRGWHQVAQAIHDETRRLLERLPALQHLRFRDGSTLVPAPCQAWLTPPHHTEQPAIAIRHDASRAVITEELTTALGSQRDQGLAALRYLEETSTMATSTCHYLANLLRNNFSQLTLQEWEPSLFTRLDQLLATSASMREHQ